MDTRRDSDDGRLAPHYERHRNHAAYSASVATLPIERVAPCQPNCKINHRIHATMAVVGHVMVEVCNACLYTTTNCLHTQNTWHDDDTRLLCDTCGADGT